MAFGITKFLKSLIIREEGTNLPKEIEITPGGTSNTKTTITSSQTLSRTVTIPDITDTLVSKNTTDILTNKSLQDTTTSIIDSVDATKKIVFDVQGATATTTSIVSAPTFNRTLTLPDITDTLVAKNTTDILTNKTLTSPVVNTPTITSGTMSGTTVNSSPIGQTTPAAGTFTSLSGSSMSVAGDPVVTVAAIQTVTNKTLSAPTINNPVLSGGTINSSQVGNLVPSTGAFTALTSSTLTTTGNVVVGGNLTVDGITTTINSQTLNVADANITVNLNGNDVSSEGAGLTINRTGIKGSIIYKDVSPSKFAIGPLASEDNIVTQTVVQTVSNKSLVDSTTSIVDSVDSTKKILFDASGTTATSTTILSSQTTNRTLTLPDITDTLVSKNSTDVLTNKTLTSPVLNAPTSTNGTFTTPTISTPTVSAGTFTNSSLINPTIAPAANFTDQATTPTTPAAGTTKIYTKTNGKAYRLASNGIEVEIGAATASTGVNLITDGNGEGAQILSLATSAVASSRPNGIQTAGAANLTVGQTTTLPLAGAQSFTISKAAINAQGQNVYIPFTIDLAYRAKAVKIYFDYIVNSGTFQAGSNFGTIQDSDLIWYILDVTNNVFIEPTSIKMLSNSSTISDLFEAEFQTSATGSSYRLIGHVATTSAIAWSIKCENFTVSPNAYVFGSPVTDDLVTNNISISAVVTAPTKGTTVTDRIISTKVGNRKFYEYEYEQSALGSNGSGDYLFSLPAGDSFNLDFITPFAGDDANGAANVLQKAYLGTGHITNATSRGPVALFAYDNTRFRVVATEAFASYNSFSNLFYGLTGTVAFKFKFSAAIAGLLSSVQMSDQTSTRIVAAKYSTSAGTTPAANTPIMFNTRKHDTHAALSAGRFTAPTAGVYRVSVSHILIGAANIEINLFKNSVSAETFASSATATSLFSGSTAIELVAGDIIDARLNSTQTLGAGATFGIERISGPSQIASSELVAASYFLSANQAVVANVTAINFDTKEFDTHSAVSTGASWKFTAPISGTYSVSGTAINTTGGVNQILYKNNVAFKLVGGSTNTFNVNYSGNLILVAGDFIELRSNSATTFIGGALSASLGSNINIIRVGN